MDFWKSGYEEAEAGSALAKMQEFVDSPTMSSNSIESSSDGFVGDQSEASKITTPKATLLAKKRLQAYSSVNKFKQCSVKEEISDSAPIEKVSKPSYKKAKKTVYPDEAAKAVIRDIELLKRAGYGFAPPAGPSSGLSSDIIIPTEPIVSISLSQLQADSSGVSLASDMEDDNTFKKREIKCRNIRKSHSFRKRSASPKNRDDRSNSQNKDKIEYPKNWTEYKEMDLNPEKDSALKSKLFSRSKDKKFEFQKYFDLKIAPVPIEVYKCQARGGESSWIPFPYLKCTATRPQIMYSTNHHTTSTGHLTREQLFALIPREKRSLIEKLGKISRCEADRKALTVRKWYPKNWKKVDNSEAKLLENSVGLSFLQSYSDEEEEETEAKTQQTLVENTTDRIIEKDTNSMQATKPAISVQAKEDLTPPGTPKTVAPNLEENFEKQVVQDVTKRKKSIWENQSDALMQNDISNYNKTPPVEEKEEGEVSEDEQVVFEKTPVHVNATEYNIATKDVLELETVVVAPNEPAETLNEIKEISIKDLNKSAKKHKKVHRDNILKKDPKRKTKKKKERSENSNISEYSESQEETSKKRKQKKKKELKTKVNSDKKRKAKKKSKKKTAELNTESEEDSDLEIRLPKKKKRKKRLNEKTRKRTISGDSRTKMSDRKSSVDIIQEEYEDDIKFFAARFDAESKLKGKTRHKTKANISLEDLTAHPKVEEKTQKRKSKWESSESDGLFSPDVSKKKHEQKIKEDSAKRGKDKEKSPEEAVKKSVVKIDLLKMNEEYLREQKRKEESETSIAKDDSSKTEKMGRSLSIDRKQTDNKSPSSGISIEKPKKILIDMDKLSEEVSKKKSLELPANNFESSENKTQLHKMQNDDSQSSMEEMTHHRSSSILNSPDKSSKCVFSNDSTADNTGSHVDLISLADIKKEKDAEMETYQIETERNTSWESEDEQVDYQRTQDNLLDFEIPLNIQHFPRREIKTEKDINTIDFQKYPIIVQYEEKKIEDVTQSTPVVNLQFESKANDDIDIFRQEFEEPTALKKGRWDTQSFTSTPLIKVEKPGKVIDLEANNSSNCFTLENEYEEFIKAVSTSKNDNHDTQHSKSSVIENSVDSTVSLRDDQINEPKLFKTDDSKSLDDSHSKKIEEVTPKPLLDIPTIQIPLPPVMSEQIKPVPVPSPKLEAVINLNKPLINLSLSANVTQNITLSLATSVPSISAPITSTIDISKPTVEISTPVPIDSPFNMNTIPLSLNQTVAEDLHNLEPDDAFISSNPETLSEIPVNNFSSIQLEEQRMNKKLVFASLTLPSKKRLIGSSKLNLDDSDDDDQSILDEIKRKKLEALIADNERDVLNEIPGKVPANLLEIPELKGINRKHGKEDNFKVTSPYRRGELSPKRSRKEQSPALRRERDSPIRRREVSPRRRLSPSKRKSPRRSPKRRSPLRRKKSPGRRSISPKRRRISISPRRRRSPSPRWKRGMSPRGRQSPHRRNRSPSPRSKRLDSSRDSSLSYQKVNVHARSISQRESSPLKRSMADSTISDDQLLQEDGRGDSKRKTKDNNYHSPERVPLDVRINQVLGYDELSQFPPKPTSSTATFYQNDDIHGQSQFQFVEQYSNIESQITTPTLRNVTFNRTPQTTYRQVGNMLQIVPTENLTDIHTSHQVPEVSSASHLKMDGFPPTIERNLTPQKTVEIRQQILQVGNMLQIVPTDMVPTELIPVPPVQTEIKIEKTEEPWYETSFTAQPEKQSAEVSMMLKVAERRAERENRRQEREKRKKEKEKRRKEKEKARQVRLKIKTENMIKRALELEEEENVDSDTTGSQHVQWPPIPVVVNHSVLKEANKGILINNSARQLDESLLSERRSKVVQFADGIRPGEGTSPSAGEDLSSPPPPKKKLPKEKRYKKVKFGKKSNKKKVKVKVIKKPPSPVDDSDSDDNLPPPSPPPGSPPPHIFPPRIKVNPVNNVPAGYLASIIQTSQQQPLQPQPTAQYQSTLYRTPVNLLMAPLPPPQGHLQSIHPHVQSPLATTTMSPQAHYHPGLAAPPPPPPPLPHSTGLSRHYSNR